MRHSRLIWTWRVYEGYVSCIFFWECGFVKTNHTHILSKVEKHHLPVYPFTQFVTHTHTKSIKGRHATLNYIIFALVLKPMDVLRVSVCVCCVFEMRNDILHNVFCLLLMKLFILMMFIYIRPSSSHHITIPHLLIPPP